MLKKKLIDIVILSASATLLIVGLSWHYNHGEWKNYRRNRVEESVYRGFEALALNDLHNAETFFSSFFNETGNEVENFFKLNHRLQTRTRYVYGDMLFCRKNFQKAEVVWRPIFKDVVSMLDFLVSGAPRKGILVSYVSTLKENKNVPEILKFFNICYEKNGNASVILKKFKDDPLLRSIAGDFFFKRNEYKKVVDLLKPLFENPRMLSKLNDKHQALSKWHYGYSSIYEGNLAKDLLSSFFDNSMKETKLFEFLDQKDQVACRVQYALMLLEENDFEKSTKLIESLFDKNGELLPTIRNIPFQDLIRNIYGYTLCKQGRYSEANKVWDWFFKAENKSLIKNFSKSEVNLLDSLRKNINRRDVDQW